MKQKSLMIVPKYNLAIHAKDYTYFFPIALGYIMSAIKNKGYDIDCINLNHEVGIKKPIKDKLDKTKYSHVLIGGNALEYPIIEQIINEIRNHNSKPKIILGGNIITSEPDLVFEALNPDIGVIGEGEETIIEILKGNKLNTIKGLIYKAKGKTIRTMNREGIKNLDTISFPDYGSLGFNEYLDNMHPNDAFYYSCQDNPKFYVVMGSRSCPFQCTFCWHYNKYRERSVDNIILEMEFAIKEYKINLFYLSDECVSLTQNRLNTLCNEIIKLKKRLKYDFIWCGMLRADMANSKLLNKMKKSGCQFIGYGLESYSEKVLNSMNKRIKPKDVKNAIDLTIKAKINVLGGFIFGDIAETKETAQETMDFYERECNGQVQLHMVKPYPNSKIYQYAVAKGIIPDKLQFIKDIVKDEKRYFNITKEMSDKDVKELETKLFKLLSKYRKTIIPKMIMTKKNTYTLNCRCPFCKKKMEYKNYVIKNKHLFHYNVLCKDCCMRFCLASNLSKFLLEHMGITSYVRDIKDTTIKQIGKIKNQMK